MSLAGTMESVEQLNPYLNRLIVNYQLSTVNYQLKKTMAIKVNARETELKFGKEATYHSAMIWKMNAESLANKTDLRRSLFVDYYKAMRREG